MRPEALPGALQELGAERVRWDPAVPRGLGCRGRHLRGRASPGRALWGGALRWLGCDPGRLAGADCGRE